MLTPEIIELCEQASVEQDVGRLLHLVSEINRQIEEHQKRFAFRRFLNLTHQDKITPSA